MVAKLCPDVLDKLDIFILEIEELEIPKVIKTNIEIIIEVIILIKWPSKTWLFTF